MKLRPLAVALFIPLLFQMGHTQMSFDTRTITLDDFLESIRRTHPFFAKEILTAQIRTEGRERSLGTQDWTVSSSPFYLYQMPIATSAFSPERITMMGAEFGIERALWPTGGRLSLSWSSDYTDQKIPDIVIPLGPSMVMEIPTGTAEFYQNKVYLTYTQPLLQNYRGRLDRLDYELAGYDIDAAEVDAAENQEAFLLNVATRFLDWVLLSEQSRIAEERLSLAHEQLDQTARMRRANLVDEVDVLRAEDAVRIARQTAVLIESQWKAKQAELAVLAQSQDLYTQTPEFDIYTQETLPPLDEAVAQLKEESRILETIEIRREQLSYLVGGYAEAGRPQLFLNVAAGLQGGDEDLAESLEMDKPDVLVSLGFSYPLGNRAASSDISRAKLEVLQLEMESENVALELEASVRNLLIQINELEEVLTLNQDQIESAEAKTAEEQRLYNQGRGQLTFVIQSRDNEQQARLTYAQNAATYHQLILTYRALVDELLPSAERER